MNEARLELVTRYPHLVGELQWVTSYDRRVCPICEKLAGKRWAPDDTSRPRPVADTHLQCMLPGTVVLAPGQVVAATQARYQGLVVEISTSGGRTLTCTPNHPVLTTSGWKAAGSLGVGDYVLATDIGQGEVTRFQQQNQHGRSPH